MSPITTHVLDTGIGKPGRNIEITLFSQKNEGWEEMSTGRTNNDGRISDLLDTEHQLEAGIYKMHFKVGSYFKSSNRPSFYPYADIIFEIKETDEHFHIPLLLSPFGYTTYRGS